MPLPPDLLELLSHTATLERLQTTEDEWGNNVYAAAETIKCFIEEQNQNFAPNDTQSRQRVGPATGWRLLTDGVGIKIGDRITIDGKVGYVTGVQVNRDETMPDLYQNVDVATEEES